MRRILVISLFVVLCVPAAASGQIVTGTTAFGGGLSFASQDSEGSTNNVNTVTLSPDVVYFVSDIFGVGGVASFARVSQGGASATSHLYLGIVEAAFDIAETSFTPFVRAGFGLARQAYSSSGFDDAVNGFAFTVQVGGYAFVNKHVSITPAFVYFHEGYSDPAGTISTFGLSLGVNGFVGN